MLMDIIRIENLHKSYGDVKAVNDLSFKIKEGELFAFLGVNGAGKSTTISMICKTLEKDSGKIYVDGVDVDENSDKIKREIGVVFQNSALDKSLSVRDNLIHRAALYGIVGKDFEEKLKELVNLLGFGDILNRPVGKLSGGQRRKADIARALIHSPKILILDEPTTGLDPQTRITLWGVVEKMRREQNMTVLLTTHYMEEAADADYVVIIDGGKKAAEGTPIELKNQYSGDFITIYDNDESKLSVLNLDYVKVSGGFRIEVESTLKATELIVKHPDVFTDYEVVKGKMDSVFLAVTGKKLTGDK
ncbi:MAG: ABC transporter ATP-binding protein [Clostridiales bacterium]|nr:ABC transporter ATP-binding protein [Clostridiales bacterium]